MMNPMTYKKSFFSALALHLFLIIVLVTDISSSRPTLVQEHTNTPGMDLPLASTPQQAVKAVSVDNDEIKKTVTRLKEEREQQKRAELQRQNELKHQAQAAKEQRLKEQQKIAKLQEEANKIAIARKKQVEEEKKHLKELAEQKILESKRIEELKKQKEALLKQQEQEAQKLAALNKKKLEEKIRAEKLKEEQALAQKKRTEQAQAAEAERKKQAEAAAAVQARQNAENQARIAGEVDKYKALIVNAIGRHWILPENADSSLSSQFRIRLAPDGMVLEVTLTRSSGDALLDRSAQTAIRKASPLPVPSDPQTFNLFRDISLTVRPEQVRG